jgi:hypothetical protein
MTMRSGPIRSKHGKNAFLENDQGVSFEGLCNLRYVAHLDRCRCAQIPQAGGLFDDEIGLFSS